MTQELENKLVEKYPEFFEYLKKHDGTIIPIQFGVETGDGWYWLIDQLMDNIQSYTKSNQKRYRVKNKILRWYTNIDFYKYKHSKPFIKLRRYIVNKAKQEQFDKFSSVQITQIKEKFGGLRFYYNGGDDYIHGMCWIAESMSYKICETCGSTENVHQTKGGWITTICDKCEQKKNENNRK